MLLPDVLEMIMLQLYFSDVLKCRLVCAAWKNVCALYSFVQNNEKLIPREKQWPSEVRRWKTKSKKSFMTFIKIFGACLSELHLDCFVTGSLDWNLTRKELHKLVQYCPNVKDFRTRERCKFYATKDIEILSKLNLKVLGIEETSFRFNNSVIKHLQTIEELSIQCNSYNERPELAYILAGCPQLRRLYISNLESDECIAYKNHPNLNDLHISCSDLCEMQLLQIALLQNLRELYFAYSLENLGPQHLQNLVKSVVSLRRVSYQGVNERYDDKYHWDWFHEVWLETEQIMIERNGVLNDGWSDCRCA